MLRIPDHSFSLPLASGHDIILRALRAEMEPLDTAPAATAAHAHAESTSDEAGFDELVADLGKTLGEAELDRLFSPDDRAAARSDPAVRRSFTKTLATWRTLHARADAKSAIESAKSEVAGDARERARLASLARGVGDAEHAARGAK